jgi:hypothetical protein
MNEPIKTFRDLVVWQKVDGDGDVPSVPLPLCPSATARVTA